jgi:outer membrane lipoprotein-sorting protein
MKLIKTSAIAIVATLVSAFTFAQTAEEIVAKHVEAIGGIAAWKKINSIYYEGKLTVQGAEINVTLTALNGKGVRQNLTVMGMTGYQIITPAAGWNFMPFQGQTTPEAMTADELKASSDDLDVQGKLVDYKSKGHTVEYLGKDDVEGTECFKLKITSKAGNVETIYIDPKTYYIVRTVQKRIANGQESDVPTDLSNYQKLPEGIVVPYSITLPLGELVLSKAEVNKPVDESLFKPSN